MALKQAFSRLKSKKSVWSYFTTYCLHTTDGARSEVHLSNRLPVDRARYVSYLLIFSISSHNNFVLPPDLICLLSSFML